MGKTAGSESDSRSSHLSSTKLSTTCYKPQGSALPTCLGNFAATWSCFLVAFAQLALFCSREVIYPNCLCQQNTIKNIWINRDLGSVPAHCHCCLGSLDLIPRMARSYMARMVQLSPEEV